MFNFNTFHFIHLNVFICIDELNEIISDFKLDLGSKHSKVIKHDKFTRRFFSAFIILCINGSTQFLHYQHGKTLFK